MVNQKKKGNSGNATNFITRNRAIKKLQISLNDFRRLCILKGIYPREPKNKKKANRGSSVVRTFYLTKEIRYLSHEPLLETLRENKIFLKKVARAKGKNQQKQVQLLKTKTPSFNLNHLVKERYPTFIDALRDLDDGLSMLFLFATMPPVDKVSQKVVKECQRLSKEFLHYVIQANALRKVFLSIKGIYYQVEIKGQEITWIVPYQFSQQLPKFVDFKVMLTFLEFYRTLLKFVNFKLYNELDLVYPPQIDKSLEATNAELSSMLVRKKGALNEIKKAPEQTGKVSAEVKVRLDTLDKKINLLKSETTEANPEADTEEGEDEEEEDDSADLEAFPDPVGEGNADSLEIMKAYTDSSALFSFKNLFANQYFYLSREVPRTSLEFVIKAFGGSVAWDPTVASGSPYKEDDPRITYQISDRPIIPNRRTDRVYVQPQWIYDSINAKALVKEDSYQPGSPLPPHLSPFMVYGEGDYVPEEAYHKDGVIQQGVETKEVEIEADDVEDDSEEEDIDDAEVDESEDEDEDEDEGFEEEEEKSKVTKRGRSAKNADLDSKDTKEMNKIMMTKKQRKLYSQMQYGIQRKAVQTEKLKEKKERNTKKTANTKKE